MHTRHMPLAVLLMLVIAACDRGAPTSPSFIASSGLAMEAVSGLAGPSGHHQHVNIELTPDMRQELATLHPIFARYHDLDKAIADGYEFVGPCVSDPALGGMGDHYSLNEEIDFGRGDGTYALDKPQYLVYAPQKNGGRRLAALDYTVPFEKWHSAEPPAFFGIPFTRNEGFGVWMFHIWLFEHNPAPAGMFANFNPTVPQC
jgi:hypothetical protein